MTAAQEFGDQGTSEITSASGYEDGVFGRGHSFLFACAADDLSIRSAGALSTQQVEKRISILSKSANGEGEQSI